MPEYLAPGVYVEEVPSSIKPIVGVSTSTAAFVGIVKGPIQIPEDNPNYDPTKPTDANNAPFRTWTFPASDSDYTKAKQAFDALCQQGVRPPRPADTSPAGLKGFRAAQENLSLATARSNAGDLADPGKPVLCTTFADFKRSFGDFSTDPDQNKLVHGVFGFFNNEGTRCFVMRYPDLTSLQAPTSLAPLEAIDEISIVAAPGITDPVVQGNIIDHCENMSDRVAILDPPEKPADLTEGSIKVMTNTDYGALYFPRIQVFDIVTKLTDPDSAEGEIYVAPSGHMAGIWARVDNTRGVFKAPANEPIHGALRRRVSDQQSSAGRDEPVRDQLHSQYQRKDQRLGSAHHRRGLECGYQVHQRSPHSDLHSQVHRRRHAMGGFRAERPESVAEDHSQRHCVPHQRVA